MITFRGINVLMAALMSGELDYATILPTIAVSAARGIPVKVLGSVSKGSSFALISRAEVGNVQALRGKRIGINSFGSSLDYVTYAAISRSGLDPSRDVIILPIGATTAHRVAALSSGSIDARMVTSPFEYSAERAGLHVSMSAHELAQLVRIANTGIGATHKKMQRGPDEVVRVLRALRLATLLIQEQREYGDGLFEESCASTVPQPKSFMVSFVSSIIRSSCFRTPPLPTCSPSQRFGQRKKRRFRLIRTRFTTGASPIRRGAD